ncbi:ATP-binding cassette domain-containing protein [Devosia sp. FKR38]|uniref:ATP-binding cassette domain-containing protein n=1 Tax=Devosia sp. FKR38 TaxID=2562312 RepID=UPI00148584A6|nr:ATP-binding cassette domain-containing protein [Devosia sp. FKR38]
MLRVDELTFAHPGQARPYVFSMSAAPGEITAVSGASGAGKSTLLDLLAGFLIPATGTMTLDGRDLLPLAPEDRPVSLLLQAQSLFEHLRTDSNVRLGLPARTPRHEADQKVKAALADVGLVGLDSQRASTLSGGQKQRAALARTLLRNRPILLLDEPFSALDDATRTTIRDLVLQLTRERGWHTILVSHHADDITAIASQRYVIADGQLIAV